MKIAIVVDTNIILSALLGGKPSVILFDGRFQFATTHFTLNEAKKYLPRLARKIGVAEEKLTRLLDELPIQIYSRNFYRDKLRAARKMMDHIDSKDTEILALAIKMGIFIWSQDKHFDKAGYSKILKTYDFIA